MMPDGEYGVCCSRAEGGFVKVVAGTDETDVFRDVSRHFRFGGTVIDHNEGSPNYEVSGHLGE